MFNYKRINAETGMTEVLVGKLVGHVVLGIIALVFIFGSFFIVSPQENGIVLRLGSIQGTAQNGLNFKLPLVDSVVKMDISTKAIVVDELAYSKDGQTVAFQATANYALNNQSAEAVYREFKRNYEAALIVPSIKEAIKTVASKYTAQGIIENRSRLPLEMKDEFSKLVLTRGFNVSAITLTNIDFDDAYENAIKNKQVQEQEALAQINITKQQDEKKKQEILKAEALAEKTKLEALALQSAQGEKLIDKIYAEAALEAAKKWNGVLPTQMIPNGALPFINLTK